MDKKNVYIWATDDYETGLKDELKKVRKEKKREKKNKLIKKVRLMSKVFYYSAKNEMFSDTTLSLAAIVGLGQGLKYNGNLKRGLTAGIATMGVFGVLSGIMNVHDNRKKIDEVASREDE